MAKDMKTKELPEETSTPEPVQAEEMAATEAPEEPLGAQVLRMLHEDHRMLMQNYDQMLAPLDNPKIKKVIEKQLMDIEKELSFFEATFAAVYPELPPLEGMVEGDMAEPMEEVPEQVEGEPTPEEAVEGMSKEPQPEMHKALRLKYRQKGMCPTCGKMPCVCKAKMMEEEPGDEENQEKPGEDFEEVPGAEGHEPGDEEFQDYEKGYVKEAHGFLGELAATNTFGDEHRMKSYHYYKTLDGISSFREASQKVENNLGNQEVPPAEWEPGAGAKAQPSSKIDSDKARQILREGQIGGKPLTEAQRGLFGAAAGRGKSQLPIKTKMNGDTEWSEQEMMEPQHQMGTNRKMCKECAGFFKELSTTMDFGDMHRQKAAHWHKVLEPMTRDEVQAGAAGPEQTSGAMDAKALRDAFLKQNEDLANITEKLSKLVLV